MPSNKIKSFKTAGIILQSIFCLFLVFGTFSIARADTNCENFYKNFNFITVTGGPGNTVEGLPKYCSASDLIMFAINTALIFAGTIAVLFIILGGFWYLTSAGNEEQSEKGKKVLINAVVGMVVITLSYAIVRIIGNTLSLGK